MTNSTSWTPDSPNSTGYTPDSVNSTNFTKDGVNSTSFSNAPGQTTSRTANTGTGIGLLLALTHAEDSTVTFTQYDTDFTPSGVNSTEWTPN